jgi:hypothetical protein
MHRFFCLALLLGGCASTPDKPQEGYETLEWCSDELIAKYRNVRTPPRSAVCGPDDRFCRKSAEAMMDCVPFLRQEAPPSDRVVHGRFVFGISTNAEGRVTDLCLIDTNLGKTPETLLCAARIARSERVRFVPGQKDQPWRVTWILE